jgi:hypothetical protein
MVYMLVLVAAAAIGGFVYWVSLRLGVDEAQTSPADGDGLPQLPPPQPIPPSPVSLTTTPAPPPPPGSLYLSLDADRPSWRTRTFGAVGLLTMVAIAALTLAFALYQAGAWVFRLIDDYARRGGI